MLSINLEKRAPSLGHAISGGDRHGRVKDSHADQMAGSRIYSALESDRWWFKQELLSCCRSRGTVILRQLARRRRCFDGVKRKGRSMSRAFPRPVNMTAESSWTIFSNHNLSITSKKCLMEGTQLPMTVFSCCLRR